MHFFVCRLLEVPGAAQPAQPVVFMQDTGDSYGVMGRTTWENVHSCTPKLSIDTKQNGGFGKDQLFNVNLALP